MTVMIIIRKRSQVKRFSAESGIQGCLAAYAFVYRPLSD